MNRLAAGSLRLSHLNGRVKGRGPYWRTGFGLLMVVETCVAVALKLTGVIAWSWWLVLAPLWAPWAVVATSAVALFGWLLAFICCAGLFAGLTESIKQLTRRGGQVKGGGAVMADAERLYTIDSLELRDLLRLRVGKKLCLLARGRALVERRSTVTREDMKASVQDAVRQVLAEMQTDGILDSEDEGGQ